ncbi:ABC transporter substrate-binding protein [Bauldia sp.]|uniref:ABC transporter substrate-binding protein n=1 Tax=Bauldia sp. TaxID=2575872 RepID=UPI003BA91F6A
MRIPRIGYAIAFVAMSGAVPATAQNEVVVWVSGEPGQTTVYDKLADRFNAENPDSVINVVVNPSDIFNPALIPALSAGEGPDLFMFGTGPGQPAAIIDGGLVADLTGYFNENGWGDTIPAGVINQTSKDGKLWAIGNEVETTAMFYNKKIFEENGIAVPETWADLEAAVETLKAAGYDTPVGLGAADKWPISHWQSMMFGRYAGPDGINDVLFADGKWTDEPFVQASARLQEMSDNGWFGPSPVAIGYAELLDSFWAGEMPMTYTGPWIISGGLNITGDGAADFGVFQMPPFEEGQTLHPTESIGSGWYIRAGSDHKDVAVAFLNSMFFDTEGRAILLSDGVVPVGPLDDALAQADVPRLTADLGQSADTYRSNGTVPAFLDTITPGNLTTASYDGLQALLLGVMTPEEFTQSLEDAWQTAKAEGTIMAPGGLGAN